MKKTLSLFLALVMIFSLSVPAASAEGTLTGKEVTLSVTSDREAICVGSTSDVYVNYTVSIRSDDGETPIPAFSFVLEGDKLATGVTDENWKYHINKESLMQPDEMDEATAGYTGQYKVVDYNPSTGYVGVAGSDGNGIVASTEIMTTVAKFEKESISAATLYTVSPTDFIAGAGDTYEEGSVKIANAFGTCTVEPRVISVLPGTTITGTLKNDEDAALTDITSGNVELYIGENKVADGILDMTTGEYSFYGVSTGSYTVEAKDIVCGGDTYNGSAAVDVAAGPVTQDLCLQSHMTINPDIKFTIPACISGLDFKDLDVSTAVRGGSGTYTYTMKGAPSWLAINENTGVIYAPDVIMMPSAAADITVTVTDGEDTGAITVSLGKITHKVIADAKEVLSLAEKNIPATEDEFNPELIYISKDGKNVYKANSWTTQKAVDTLQKAIDAADSKAVLSDKEASALETAVATFKKSCKSGSRVDCDSFVLSVSKKEQVMTQEAPYELSAGKSASFDIVQTPAKTTETFSVRLESGSGFTAKLSGTKVTVTADKKLSADAAAHFTVTSSSGKTKDIFVKAVIPTTKLVLSNSQNAKAPTLTCNGAEETRTLTLTAVATPDTHTDTISWNITKGADCAELSTQTGNTCTVTAKSAGSVTVEASASGKKATVTIKVGWAANTITVTTSKTLVSSGVNTYATSVQAGKTVSLKAAAAIAGSKDKPIDSTLVWSIENITTVEHESVTDAGAMKEYATVDAKGTVKALKACAITVKAHAKSGSEDCQDVTFIVNATPVLKSFALVDASGKKVSALTAAEDAKGSGAIDLKEYCSIVWADGTPQGGEYAAYEEISFALDAKSSGCGTLADGVFTPAAAAGTAKVTATLPSMNKTATVTIKLGRAADTITVTTSKTLVSSGENTYDTSVLAGKTVSLKATAVIAGSKIKPIESGVDWSITKITPVKGADITDTETIKEYATVDAKGTVKALKACTITVKAAAKVGTVACQPATFIVKATPVLNSVKLLDSGTNKAVSKMDVERGKQASIASLVRIAFTGAAEDYEDYTIEYTAAKNAYGVTVDENGIVSVPAEATVKKTVKITVTVTCGSQKKTANVTITVK